MFRFIKSEPTSAPRLSGLLAAVGLAQNTAALKALASEGIQRGHMALHARQIALAAGADAHEVEIVASELLGEGRVGLVRAAEVLRGIREVAS